MFDETCDFCDLCHRPRDGSPPDPRAYRKRPILTLTLIAPVRGRYIGRAEGEGLGWFVSRRRQEAMRGVFGVIDADGQGTLDHEEANSFLSYICTAYMGIDTAKVTVTNLKPPNST